MQKKLSELVLNKPPIQKIFVIGGGASLLQQPIHLLDAKQHFIITCNEAFTFFPNAMISHHADYSWWQEHQNQLNFVFKGSIKTGAGLGTNLPYPDNSIETLTMVKANNQDLLFRTPEYIYGNNCGLQALSLAHLMRPKHIILLGFDFKIENHQTHSYKNMPTEDLKRLQIFWAGFLKNFEEFEHFRQLQWHKVHPHLALPKIWNTNPDSALNLYDKSKSLEELLEL